MIGVIYTVISNYICVDYLGTEPKQLGELVIGSSGSFKHVNKSYDKILGIGIPYLLINLMSCHGFWISNIMLSWQNVLKGCLNTISQKDSFILMEIKAIWKNFHLRSKI